MSVGTYKLARQTGSSAHYAVVDVIVTPGAKGVHVGDAFAWLKDVYGPDAWEWRVCGEYRYGARLGAAYALAHLVDGPKVEFDVEVTRIHALPIDTSWQDVAYAACRAVWDAMGDPGREAPGLDHAWPPWREET